MIVYFLSINAYTVNINLNNYKQINVRGILCKGVEENFNLIRIYIGSCIWISGQVQKVDFSDFRLQYIT